MARFDKAGRKTTVTRIMALQNRKVFLRVGADRFQQQKSGITGKMLLGLMNFYACCSMQMGFLGMC